MQAPPVKNKGEKEQEWVVRDSDLRAGPSLVNRESEVKRRG